MVSSSKHKKNFTGELDQRKLLNRFGFVQMLSAHCKEQCRDYPIVRVKPSPVTGNYKYCNCKNNNNVIDTVPA